MNMREPGIFQARSLTGSFCSSVDDPPQTTAAEQRRCAVEFDRGLQEINVSVYGAEPVTADAAVVVRARMGHEAVEALFTRNPRCVIEGLPLSGARQRTSKRRWWSG